MDKLTPPDPLDLDGSNVSDAWRKWKQRFELFSLASGLSSKDEGIQAATLLHVVGPDALEVYNTFSWEDGSDKNKAAKILEKFEAYCVPRRNITWERHMFNTRDQHDGETIDQYVTDLKTKAQTCEFKDLKDSLIRDRIVCGIHCDKTRSRLLREPDLTLQKAVDICRANETTSSQMKLFTGDQTNGLPAIHGIRSQSKQVQKVSCDRCGGWHTKQQICPAFGAECRKCGQRNHFAKVCRTRVTQPLHNYSIQRETPDSDDLFIGTLGQAHGVKDWSVTILMNQQKTTFKIDTGAQCNVIPQWLYYQVCKDPLKPSSASLVAFGGHKLHTCGKAKIPCQYKDLNYLVEFEVMDHNVPNILGLITCIEMNLVQRIDTVGNSRANLFEQYYDVFEGLGCVTDVRYHIRIDPIKTPVIHPPRRVPITLRPKIQEELARMESLDVIEKVTEPTSWVNSMVTIIKPNGSLRICIDPRNLNEAIQREHYPMQTIEEVTTRMPNATYFSVLDASSGYWQISLDQESAKLCTFNSPFGRYMFKRLPFGLSSAQDVFQKVMTEMFEDIDGVEVVVDDILVWGATEAEHDAGLIKVLDRARLRNLKLNKAKCQFKKQEITYLGHVLTKDGLKPDPKKTQAINDMTPPTSKEALQRFLGMITYLSKFIPNLSQTAAPLRALLEKDAKWQWHPEHLQSFSTLKHLASSAPVLAYFNPRQPVKLSVDASSKGLGAVLLQNDHPIAYASRALTDTQQRYAQIEKEMLAIVFGCTKFHDYIYGMPDVEVESDHKPLEAILRKPLHQAPLRLQKMIMTTQKYSLNVTYRPGKQLVLADTLSRAFLPECGESIEEKFDINILQTLPISETKLDQLREETKKDPHLQQLASVIATGWPETKQEVPANCLPYWNYRDELSICNDIIFKGEKVIIPNNLRHEMLHNIHSSHLGMEKCKRRARDVMFWPGMAAQIQDIVANCHICSTHQRNNMKEPMISHEIPTRPWSQVGADLFEINNQKYLVMVDYYSGFIEVNLLQNGTTSKHIVTHCKSQFSRHGIPDKLITDNGPQFSSAVFKQFAQDYGFQHLTSSPHYPQSNGMAEKAVQTTKNLIKKAILSKRDPYLALLEYRNTPISDTLGSPAQRLMGRRTKTLLPTTAKLLQPKLINPQTVRKELRQRKTRQKIYYDRHTATLKPLTVGDTVMMRAKGKWEPATVIAISADGPRSYIVNTPSGQKYRRNRRHLKPAPRSLDASHHYTANQSYDNWLDEDSIADYNDTAEMEIPAEQDSNPSPHLQLRRSQRTIRKPSRYTDTDY